MKTLTRRLEKLEKALLSRTNNQEDHGIDVSWMTPLERRERIRCLVDEMTDEEIALFEKKNSFPEGYIKSNY